MNPIGQVYGPYTAMDVARAAYGVILVSGPIALYVHRVDAYAEPIDADVPDTWRLIGVYSEAVFAQGIYEDLMRELRLSDLRV